MTQFGIFSFSLIHLEQKGQLQQQLRINIVKLLLANAIYLT